MSAGEQPVPGHRERYRERRGQHGQREAFRARPADELPSARTAVGHQGRLGVAPGGDEPRQERQGRAREGRHQQRRGQDERGSQVELAAGVREEGWQPRAYGDVVDLIAQLLV